MERVWSYTQGKHSYSAGMTDLPNFYNPMHEFVKKFKGETL